MARRKTKESKRKAAQAGKEEEAAAQMAPDEKVPRTMMFARGKINILLKRLVQDMRKMLLPFTALKLKESRRNNLKDFLHVAGPLGVTHFLMLSKSDVSPYLRVARTPRGPTLTFRILDYSLAADVAKSQRRPYVPAGVFEAPPLVVMNGMGATGRSGTEHLKLMTIMFQNMFPPINVSTVKLSDCRRVLLLNHDPATGTIDLRHYAITARPVGVSKPLRNLVHHHALPNLSHLSDISELVTRPAAYASDSEADEGSRVQAPQDMGRGVRAAQQSQVKLHELGPRVTLLLVKVEEGLSNGAVMYHRFVEKTAEEEADLQQRAEERLREKKRRKEEQEANVRRKKMLKASKGKAAEGDDSGEEEQGRAVGAREGEEEEEEEDDAGWYRKEPLWGEGMRAVEERGEAEVEGEGLGEAGGEEGGGPGVVGTGAEGEEQGGEEEEEEEENEGEEGEEGGRLRAVEGGGEDEGG
ncbi:hypothetical protein CLOP_g8541 [Closterium sp. NIES-67]|nr:hypothetical protein CLOP_g8541 [Closterium sp. NIES-67]